MADEAGFLTGETLDFIFDDFDIDELDEIFEEDFIQAVDEIAEEEIQEGQGHKCTECEKVCKSKGGLTLHKRAKHQQHLTSNLLAIEDLTAMLTEIKTEVIRNQCFDAAIHNSFQQYSISVSPMFLTEINNIYTEYLANKSKTDKFLATFYGTVVLFPEKFDLSLPIEHSTLLLTKLAQKLLYFEKGPAATVIEAPAGITSYEIHSLQYLSGYVIKHTLKHLRKKKLTERVNKLIQILMKCKADDTSDQELVATLDRGGLTGTTRQCVAIFKICEFQFRNQTNGFLKKLPIDEIADNLMENEKLQELYFEMADLVELEDEGKFDLLEKLVSLYLRVRAYTLSRDKLSAYKEKRTSKHGLRKNLKKKNEKDKKLDSKK